MLSLRRSVTLAFLSVAAVTSANAQSGQFSGTNSSLESEYTIQVAAYPSLQLAAPLIQQLTISGEAVASGYADVPGKGKWVRVLVGAFSSAQAARRHAGELVSKGIIQDFLIKPADEYRLFSKAAASGAGSPAPSLSSVESRPESAPVKKPPALPVLSSTRLRDISKASTQLPDPRMIDTSMLLLPELESLPISLLTGARPQADGLPVFDARVVEVSLLKAMFAPPVLSLSATSVVTRESGGLYLSGDVENAMDRLAWILGPENQSVISLEPDGRVRLDQQALERAARVQSPGQAGGALMLEQFISSNEGLLLMVQLTQSKHRYRLHVGATMPTLEGNVKVDSSVNLDDRYDSRINGLRRLRSKRACELPPSGFSAAIGINPSARWVNLESNRLVPEGLIAFHELAEAYAKIDLSVEYISEKTAEPGAHQLALAREVSLRSQRPDLDFALTCGTNQVFRSYEEVTRFTTMKASLVRNR